MRPGRDSFARMALGALLAAAAMAAPARAEPPNLNILDGEAGETEVELTGFTASSGGPGFQFNSEINHAFSDRFGVQLQVTGGNDGDGLRADDVSLQALAKVAALPNDGSVGVSLEAGVAPADGAVALGALVYGVGGSSEWRVAFNLGGEASTSGQDASMVYAWSLTHPLSERWSLGVEGGGASTVRGGAASEHYAGPAIGWRLTQGEQGPWLRLGWLVGLGRASPDLVVTGVVVTF